MREEEKEKKKFVEELGRYEGTEMDEKLTCLCPSPGDTNVDNGRR